MTEWDMSLPNMSFFVCLSLYSAAKCIYFVVDLAPEMNSTDRKYAKMLDEVLPLFYPLTVVG